MYPIGPKIKEIRESQQLTQEELATRCNLLGWGISRGTFTKVETRVRRITDDEIELFAKALNVEIKELYS